MVCSRIFLLITSVLGIRAVRILNLWVFIELNMLIFILILSLSSRKKDAPVAIIYFCPQALGSLIFLFSFFWALLSLNSRILIFLLRALVLKLGLPPFHSWFLDLGRKLESLEFILLSTIQKIIPIFAFSSFAVGNTIFWVRVWAFSRVILALKQAWLIKILAISSILNTAWALAPVRRFSLSLLFIGAYSVNLALVLYYQTFFCSKTFKAIIRLKSSLSIGIILAILSLSGFPPSLGFLAKLILVLHISATSVVIVTILVLCSASFFYIYARFIIPKTISSSAPIRSSLTQGFTLWATLIFSWRLPFFIILLCIGVMHKKFWFFRP